MSVKERANRLDVIELATQHSYVTRYAVPFQCSTSWKPLSYTAAAQLTRGVVHSQIGCTNFKYSKKSLDLLDFSDFYIFFGFFCFSNFLSFSDFFYFFGFFWVYENFMNKKGFEQWHRGVVHSQIMCTDFKSSKEIFGFFRIFRIFFSVRGFFWVNNPSKYLATRN